MATLKVCGVIVLVFLLSLGAYYVVENRHDAELHQTNKALAETNAQATKEKVEVIQRSQRDKEKLAEVLVSLYPKDKDTIEKIIWAKQSLPPPPPAAGKVEEKATAEKEGK